MREFGIIKLNYLPSKDMTIDVLSKPLRKPSFTIHRKGLTDITDSCRRRDVRTDGAMIR